MAPAAAPFCERLRASQGIAGSTAGEEVARRIGPAPTLGMDMIEGQVAGALQGSVAVDAPPPIPQIDRQPLVGKDPTIAHNLSAL